MTLGSSLLGDGSHGAPACGRRPGQAACLNSGRFRPRWRRPWAASCRPRRLTRFRSGTAGAVGPWLRFLGTRSPRAWSRLRPTGPASGMCRKRTPAGMVSPGSRPSTRTPARAPARSKFGSSLGQFRLGRASPELPPLDYDSTRVGGREERSLPPVRPAEVYPFDFTCPGRFVDFSQKCAGLIHFWVRLTGPIALRSTPHPALRGRARSGWKNSLLP